MNNKNKL